LSTLRVEIQVALTLREEAEVDPMDRRVEAEEGDRNREEHPEAVVLEDLLREGHPEGLHGEVLSSESGPGPFAPLG
jgi:hypothetical protein